ncbi:MAG: cyclopropane-fatty-acyl-phospholipid synthase family protein [Proteobacteria bacterium]|nr:cyclopropane-fatty-acyl-phospholipid synthase family protein [Pseudomonadota bacterium]
MILSTLLRIAFARNLGRTEIPFEVHFTNGSIYKNKEIAPEFVIRYKTFGAQLNTVFNTGWGLFESYINQTVEISGNIQLIVKAWADSGPNLAEHNRMSRIPNPFVRFRNWLHELKHSNRRIKRAVKNAHHHYNRGTDMFWKYLDPSMTYTCAYWKEGTKTLEEAQRNKLDHVCKKLRLKPGETMVDVGGGWGSLLFHAAENYGVKGTNISPTPDQNQALRTEAARRGLQNKITIQQKDFREVEGTFDKYASLGAFEHAGKGQLADWIKAMADSLKPGGIGVLHFIAHDRPIDTDFFIRKYIFPGGYLPGLSETVDIMSTHGLEILDIENLRRHYALTLDAWAENFEKHWEDINHVNPEHFDEKFKRTWRTYLALCAEYFRIDNSILRLYQITFSKGNTSSYPMDRGFLYDQIPADIPQAVTQSTLKN